MIAGNGWEIHHDVAAAGAADDVFPVRNGKLVAVRHHKPSPGFRLALKFQQGLCTAPENEQRKKGRGITPKRTENLREPCPVRLEVFINQGKERFHCIASSLEVFVNEYIILLCRLFVNLPQPALKAVLDMPLCQ